MKANLDDLPRQCPVGSHAPPAFTCCDLEQAVAVVNASAPREAPCVLYSRRGIDAHLTLHGASGPAKEDIAHGFVKTNVDTESRRRYFDTLTSAAPDRVDGWRLLELGQGVRAALDETVTPLLTHHQVGHSHMTPDVGRRSTREFHARRQVVADFPREVANLGCIKTLVIGVLACQHTSTPMRVLRRRGRTP